MPKTIHRPEYEILLRRLRELRLRSGMTQVELSERLGRAQPFISDVERGVRRLDALELRDICRALGGDLVAFLRALEVELAALPAPRARRPGKRVKH